MNRHRNILITALVLLAGAGCGVSPQEASWQYRVELGHMAKMGDVEALTRELDSGAPLDDATWANPPLLHEAASGWGLIELYSRLSKEGKFPDEKAAMDALRARAKGQVETVRLLLSRGADPNQRHNWKWRQRGEGAEGRTPLQVAAAGRTYYRPMDFLLGVRANRYPQISLWGAVKAIRDNQQAAIIEVLLDHGSEIEARIGQGPTPLLTAIDAGNHAAVDLLIERGADMAAQDSRTGSALHWAALNGDLKMVKKLINLRINVNAKTKSDKTPLQEVMRFCTFYDWSKDLPFYGRSPRLETYEQIVETLLEHGADSEGALGPAVAIGSARMIRALLKSGASLQGHIHVPFIRHGWLTNGSVLHHAVASERIEIAAILLDHGADINERSPVESVRPNPLDSGKPLKNGGDTALHIAVRRAGIHQGTSVFGARRMIQLLLDRGASIDIANAAGRTPLDIAEGVKIRHTFDFAEENKALKFAIENHWGAIKRLLEEKPARAPESPAPVKGDAKP